MAVHQRNTASSHAQEPPLTIARVALYARVSTCNGQDPEMQLRELREYASRRGWTITSEYIDLSTPSGRLMFQIIGAMAEFERSLIQERVKAGLRNARAKGKKFGRPRAQVDADRVFALRRDRLSWSKVCRTLNVSKGSAQRSVARLPKRDGSAYVSGQEL